MVSRGKDKGKSKGRTDQAQIAGGGSQFRGRPRSLKGKGKGEGKAAYNDKGKNSKQGHDGKKHENNHGRSWYNHGSDDEYAQSPNHKRSRFDDETGELTATSYGDGRGQGKVFSPTKDSNPHQGKDYPNESISKQDFYNLSREDQILAMVSKLFWSHYVYLYFQIWFLSLVYMPSQNEFKDCSSNASFSLVSMILMILEVVKDNLIFWIVYVLIDTRFFECFSRARQNIILIVLQN